MAKDNNNNLLEMLEMSVDFVAAMTGLKQQFVDAGWDERNAERMVHAILMSQSPDK